VRCVRLAPDRVVSQCLPGGPSPPETPHVLPPGVCFGVSCPLRARQVGRVPGRGAWGRSPVRVSRIDVAPATSTARPGWPSGRSTRCVGGMIAERQCSLRPVYPEVESGAPSPPGTDVVEDGGPIAREKRRTAPCGNTEPSSDIPSSRSEEGTSVVVEDSEDERVDPRPGPRRPRTIMFLISAVAATCSVVALISPAAGTAVGVGFAVVAVLDQMTRPRH
jgi:hypothetical protein